jgi:hypothetical protein
MSNFFSSLFGGSNSTLSGAMNNTGNIAGFASGVGQGNVTNSSNFFNSLLSGNSKDQAKVLAPQIKTMQDQGQQQLNTTSQFGNRSGGTNASNQKNMDTTRGNIDNAISSLTGSAASNLMSSGQSLLGTSLNAYQKQEQMSQDQMANWANSILGKGITGAAAAGESFGLGAGAGALSGTGAGTGGMTALFGTA